MTSSPNPPSWSKSVQWEKADLLDPPSYKPLLKDADAVIHTMGILLEADYKGVLTGKESPISGLRRAFSGTKAGGSGSKNPFERGTEAGEEAGKLQPREKDGQLTYELMNRDTAITLAHSASEAGVPTFIYISAAAGTPILPSRYITTKREAESTIASRFPQMRSLFFRPAFLYDGSRWFTMPIAAAGGVGYLVNWMVGGRLTALAGAAVEKPLRADLVAEGVVEGVEDGGVKGVVGTEGIEGLAGRGWRRGML